MYSKIKTKQTHMFEKWFLLKLLLLCDLNWIFWQKKISNCVKFMNIATILKKWLGWLWFWWFCKLSAKINTNSNMTFESKMNLKSISVCSKSIKITAILMIFFRWLKYSWNWYSYLSFSVRKSSLNHTKAEVSMEITFQTCGFVLIFEYIHLCVILQSFSYPFYRFVTAISTFLNYIFSTVKITNLCI